MTHLTLDQRYEISKLLHQGYSQKEIAVFIGVNSSTISRELKRNSDSRNGVYKPKLAQHKTVLRHKEKPKYSSFNQAVKDFVISYLKEDYSPEQIAGIAKLKGISCVSHERIYQFIWEDKKQGGSLYKHLRSKGKRYRKRGNVNNKRGQIVGRVSIDKRPKIVERKERFGDLEIDLIVGAGHSGALLTINDRATGLLNMRKLSSKEAEEIETKTIKALEHLQPFIKTITSDNGKEFANHSNIAQALDIDFYFADPYHSWQRGANENLNGLVRQYFPKNYNFELISDQEVKTVEDKLNNRPRKRYGYLTPNQMFDTFVENYEIAFIS